MAEIFVKIREKIILSWRIIFIIMFIGIMLFSIILMRSSDTGIVDTGKVDISSSLLEKNGSVRLDGLWEFYWNRLLMPSEFNVVPKPQMDSLIKVPGSWDGKGAGAKKYPNHGVATYRLIVNYPANIEDPALRIKTISAAYKLYANGQLILEVGKVSDKLFEYKGDYKQFIVDLPKDKQELELIFQVANLDYIRGGLRDSVEFGSKRELEKKKLLLLTIQMLVIGNVFAFSIHYFISFISQRKNRTTLIFSILCFITAIRALAWGETPFFILFPKVPLNVGLIIEYFSEYNTMPIIILFVINMYPFNYKKKILVLILLPTLFFDALLMAPSGVRASFFKCFYILMLLQMVYVLAVLIKAVLSKRDYAELMLMAIGIYILTITAFLLDYIGIGVINLSYIFLFGNFAIIIALSYIQVKQQAMYNERLIEADILKDKVMATEMSFLQAQIKPHFLYNALNAIANVCEKDGIQASRLIEDLAIYLRGSLEFNNLDRMVTIEEELKIIDKYFNIEQARFGPKIKLVKDIEMPLNCRIPAFILQPLVENAVRHGISKKNGGGTVYIKMKQINEGICLEIEDDGVGMNNDKLATLLNEERKEKGVGLLNIHHRLLRLFDKGLHITSEVGCGTCVRLIIPEGRIKL